MIGSSREKNSMSSGDDDRFAFLAEWYDPLASIVRSYQLFYYAKDGAVEMFDLKLRRPFLKKMKIPELRLSDLYVGSSINVLSRHINLVDFGDEYTRRKLSAKTEKTLAVVPLSSPEKLGDILDNISAKGLLIVNMKMVKLTAGAAAEFCRVLPSDARTRALQAALMAGPALVMEVVGSDATALCQRILAPARAHVSEKMDNAIREINFFFGEGRPVHVGTATISSQATCAVVRPHAVAAGLTGGIISAIMHAGFNVSAIQMFHLDRSSAEEFSEIYKGVVSEYPAMVSELTSGACVAMEVVCRDGSGAYGKFREFVGPSDPEIARHLRPHTLRAQFGVDKVQNAIHCTDLPEDTVLELQYFFQLLDN